MQNLSYSSFNYEIVKEVNDMVKNCIDEICIANFDETMPFAQIDTAILPPSEIDSFNNGVIIAGHIDIAHAITGCANNSYKLLYMYDLEWMFKLSDYGYLYDILSNSDLKIVLRSKDHISPFYNLTKREPDSVIEKFNLEKIWNLL
jgi:hypothetical protein